MCRTQQESAGQLAGSRSPDNTVSSYSYDRSGNILSKDGRSHLNRGWQISRITDSSGNITRDFEYRADGYLTKELDGSGQAVRTMNYDSLGRMTNLNSTTFAYDSNGRMIKATSGDGSVTYYPSESYEVTVRGPTTTRTAYLVHQNRRASISTVVVSDRSQTSVSYYHSNHLGSIVAVSDGTGDIVTTYSYDDFGAVTVNGPDNSRYKYSGKEAFEGLYYFGARFYDPMVHILHSIC